MKEQVLLAERTVLYTLGFDLNADPPHMLMLRLMGELLPPTTTPQHRDLLQTCWNFLNDRCGRCGRCGG